MIAKELFLRAVNLAGQRVEKVNGDALHEAFLIYVTNSSQEYQNNTIIFKQLKNRFVLLVVLDFVQLFLLSTPHTEAAG